MNDYKGRWVMVTGASSGIGEAFVRAYAKRGAKLVLVARREDRLDALAEQLYKQHGTQCCVLAADLSDPESPARLFAETEKKDISVDILVNNAGHGLMGGYRQNSWKTHAQFLQLMVTAVCELSYLYLPGMLERGYGRIVNVSSIASLLPASANQTLYAASKAFMNRFTEALSSETEQTGVRVTAICPGLTDTEFFDAAGNREQVKNTSKWLWYSPAAVAEEAIDASEADRVVVIAGRVYRFIYLLTKLLPYALVRRLNKRARKGQGLSNKSSGG